MSKEGYSSEKREGENKVLLLERLQTYLKDKKSSDVAEAGLSYSKPSTSYEHDHPPPFLEESTNILRDVLNHKKAELLRQPEIVSFLKSVSSDLKK